MSFIGTYKNNQILIPRLRGMNTWYYSLNGVSEATAITLSSDVNATSLSKLNEIPNPTADFLKTALRTS